MRWFHIENFEIVEKGRLARAVKNVSLGEEILHDHFPGFPVYPSSLLLEAMAQTGGILAGHASGFDRDLYLAKIDGAKFFRLVLPGARLDLEAEVMDLRPEGCLLHARASSEGDPVAEANILLVHAPTGKRIVFHDGFLSHFAPSGERSTVIRLLCPPRKGE